MAQYQTFPGVAGDSATLDKLKALRFPSLAGLSFLDIGCNEGFFCGYARFDGASRVVGIDQSSLFIERARQRFTDCEFLQQSWDQLPPGPFDVILLASSLHYADDQPALIHRLMQTLAPNGTLVLEIGVARSTKAEWVKVKRGIDERLFPSMPLLRELLQDYAWKHIGPSVLQAGDPVPRHVFHVQRRKPFAYLLLQPPAYGKSTIGRLLFRRAGIRTVSGDELLLQVSRGKLEAPPELEKLVRKHFSMTAIDQVTEKIFGKGLEKQLLEVVLQLADGEDFALDSYVPTRYQAKVEAQLMERGYLPVFLQWEKAVLAPSASKVSESKGDAYFKKLSTSAPPPASATDVGARVSSIAGFVEQLTLTGGWLQVGGWALLPPGQQVDVLEVRLGTKILVPEVIERIHRPDVLQHFGLDRGQLGFSFRIAATDIQSPKQLRQVFQLFVGASRDRLSGPLPLTQPLVQRLDEA